MDRTQAYLESSRNPLRTKLTKTSVPAAKTKKPRKKPLEVPIAVSNPGLLKKLQAELEELVGAEILQDTEFDGLKISPRTGRPLPGPWTVHVASPSLQNGHDDRTTFYHNPKTGSTQWSEPEETGQGSDPTHSGRSGDMATKSSTPSLWMEPHANEGSPGVVMAQNRRRPNDEDQLPPSRISSPTPQRSPGTPVSLNGNPKRPGSPLSPSSSPKTPTSGGRRRFEDVSHERNYWTYLGAEDAMVGHASFDLNMPQLVRDPRGAVTTPPLPRAEAEYPDDELLPNHQGGEHADKRRQRRRGGGGSPSSTGSQRNSPSPSSETRRGPAESTLGGGAVAADMEALDALPSFSKLPGKVPLDLGETPSVRTLRRARQRDRHNHQRAQHGTPLHPANRASGCAAPYALHGNTSPSRGRRRREGRAGSRPGSPASPASPAAGALSTTVATSRTNHDRNAEVRPGSGSSEDRGSDGESTAGGSGAGGDGSSSSSVYSLGSHDSNALPSAVLTPSGRQRRGVARVLSSGTGVSTPTPARSRGSSDDFGAGGSRGGGSGGGVVRDACTGRARAVVGLLPPEGVAGHRSALPILPVLPAFFELEERRRRDEERTRAQERKAAAAAAGGAERGSLEGGKPQCVHRICHDDHGQMARKKLLDREWREGAQKLSVAHIAAARQAAASAEQQQQQQQQSLIRGGVSPYAGTEPRPVPPLDGGGVGPAFYGSLQKPNPRRVPSTTVAFWSSHAASAPVPCGMGLSLASFDLPDSDEMSRDESNAGSLAAELVSAAVHAAVHPSMALPAVAEDEKDKDDDKDEANGGREGQGGQGSTLLGGDTSVSGTTTTTNATAATINSMASNRTAMIALEAAPLIPDTSLATLQRSANHATHPADVLLVTSAVGADNEEDDEAVRRDTAAVPTSAGVGGEGEWRLRNDDGDDDAPASEAAPFDPYHRAVTESGEAELWRDAGRSHLAQPLAPGMLHLSSPVKQPQHVQPNNGAAGSHDRSGSGGGAGVAVAGGGAAAVVVSNDHALADSSGGGGGVASTERKVDAVARAAMHAAASATGGDFRDAMLAAVAFRGPRVTAEMELAEIDAARAALAPPDSDDEGGEEEDDEDEDESLWHDGGSMGLHGARKSLSLRSASERTKRKKKKKKKREKYLLSLEELEEEDKRMRSMALGRLSLLGAAAGGPQLFAWSAEAHEAAWVVQRAWLKHELRRGEAQKIIRTAFSDWLFRKRYKLFKAKSTRAARVIGEGLRRYVRRWKQKMTLTLWALLRIQSVFRMKLARARADLARRAQFQKAARTVQLIMLARATLVRRRKRRAAVMASAATRIQSLLRGSEWRKKLALMETASRWFGGLWRRYFEKTYAVPVYVIQKRARAFLLGARLRRLQNMCRCWLARRAVAARRVHVEGAEAWRRAKEDAHVGAAVARAARKVAEAHAGVGPDLRGVEDAGSGKRARKELKKLLRERERAIRVRVRWAELEQQAQEKGQAAGGGAAGSSSNKNKKDTVLPPSSSAADAKLRRQIRALLQLGYVPIGYEPDGPGPEGKARKEKRKAKEKAEKEKKKAAAKKRKSEAKALEKKEKADEKKRAKEWAKKHPNGEPMPPSPKKKKKKALDEEEEEPIPLKQDTAKYNFYTAFTKDGPPPRPPPPLLPLPSGNDAKTASGKPLSADERAAQKKAHSELKAQHKAYNAAMKQLDACVSGGGSKKRAPGGVDVHTCRLVLSALGCLDVTEEEILHVMRAYTPTLPLTTRELKKQRQEELKQQSEKGEEEEEPGGAGEGAADGSVGSGSRSEIEPAASSSSSSTRQEQQQQKQEHGEQAGEQQQLPRLLDGVLNPAEEGGRVVVGGSRAGTPAAASSVGGSRPSSSSASAAAAATAGSGGATAAVAGGKRQGENVADDASSSGSGGSSSSSSSSAAASSLAQDGVSLGGRVGGVWQRSSWVNERGLCAVDERLVLGLAQLASSHLKQEASSAPHGVAGGFVSLGRRFGAAKEALARHLPMGDGPVSQALAQALLPQSTVFAQAARYEHLRCEVDEAFVSATVAFRKRYPTAWTCPICFEAFALYSAKAHHVGLRSCAQRGPSLGPDNPFTAQTWAMLTQGEGVGRADARGGAAAAHGGGDNKDALSEPSEFALRPPPDLYDDDDAVGSQDEGNAVGGGGGGGGGDDDDSSFTVSLAGDPIAAAKAAARKGFWDPSGGLNVRFSNGGVRNLTSGLFKST